MGGLGILGGATPGREDHLLGLSGTGDGHGGGKRD
jgi:hypothetical protein